MTDRLSPPESRSPDSIWSTRAGIAFAFLTVALAVATIAGLLLLWPTGADHTSTAQKTVAAKATAVSVARCGGETGQSCRTMKAKISDGRDRGATVKLLLGPTELAPQVDVGDSVRLADVGKGASLPLAQRYSFGSVDRRTPLLILAIVVGVLAVVLVRWRGALAIGGLILSLGLIVLFVLPAITEGAAVMPTALAAAMAVTFVTVILTSGLGIRTVTAIVSIALTLAIVAAAIALMANLASLDGRTTEIAAALTQANSSISLKGVVIAGVILGALGALTDTAVTQASAVMALRRADPSLAYKKLYSEAANVGRDHLSATIHTLVLAYTGASLPLLLVIHASGVPAVDAFSSQDLATPIVAALVGSLALLICVPVSTGLAAWLATHVPAQSLPEGHGHAH